MEKFLLVERMALLPEPEPARRLPPFSLASFAVPDWAASTGWADLGPDRWPRPPLADSVFGRIRLFVYPLPGHFHREVMRLLVILTKSAYGSEEFCLVRGCNLGWDDRANLRLFTSEVPVLLRMLQVCTIVTDPRQASAFLVPFPMGTWAVAGWYLSGLQPPLQRPASIRDNERLVASHLTFLNESTAERHIFLHSIESAFLGIGAHIPHVHRSIVMHQGDDKWNATPPAFPPAVMRRLTRFNRSIVLPVRAVPAPMPTDLHAPRRLLVYGAFGDRHPERGRVADVLRADARRLGLQRRVLLGPLGDFGSFDEATALASEASYCVCPHGDAPGFSQRLFVALQHACVPVFVDLYERSPAEAAPAWPYQHLVDWKRAAVFATRSTIDGLLSRLAADERSIVGRRLYIREMARWLAFDAVEAKGEPPPQDAASAALYELATLLGIDTSPE